MLPEPLWPGTEFAWAEMIRADLYPVISWTRSKTHRLKTLKAFVWAISLHHFEGDDVSAIYLLEQWCLHAPLSLAGYVNPRVNPKAYGHWGEGIIFTWSSFPWKTFFYLFPGFPWYGKILAEGVGGTSDPEIITLLFLLANDIKGWATVVVFNHFLSHTLL